MIAVVASTVPLAQMSLLALAVKDAARGGARSDSEYRFGEGAGGFAERLAAGLGGRLRLQAEVTGVRQTAAGVEVTSAGGEPIAAARVVVAVPLHRHAAIQGLRPAPADATYGVAVKSLIELDGELPSSAPTSAVTDSVLGYAYRRDQRTLGAFVGSVPARRLAAMTGSAATRGAGRAGAAMFGVGVRRVPA